MDMAASPPRPFLLLCERTIDNGEKTMVECASKVAYGCGPLGQQIVEGLTLFASLDNEGYPGPAFGVRATGEVLGRLGEEIPAVLANIWGRVELAAEVAELYGIYASLSGSVLAVDDDAGIVVLRVSFVDSYHNRQIRSYYLIYDSAAASLSMLPCMPSQCAAVCTTRPLPVRRHDGGYSLVLMVLNYEPRMDDMSSEQPVLCLWSPPPAPAPESSCHDHLDGYSIGPWRIRQRRHATAIPTAWFESPGVDLEVFSYRGKAFWADLTQGILYCDCAALLDNGGDDAPAVEFTFVALSEEYRIERLEYKDRAMGVGIGDSVWFVVLESCDRPEDTNVVVLSLDLSDGGVAEGRWVRHLELSLLSIWALEGFAAAGLPTMVPSSPFLTKQDAGVIYLFLPPADMSSRRACHLIGIDVRDRNEPRLLPRTRHTDVSWCYDQQPLLLAPDFLDRQRN